MFTRTLSIGIARRTLSMGMASERLPIGTTGGTLSTKIAWGTPSMRITERALLIVMTGTTPSLRVLRGRNVVVRNKRLIRWSIITPLGIWILTSSWRLLWYETPLRGPVNKTFSGTAQYGMNRAPRSCPILIATAMATEWEQNLLNYKRHSCTDHSSRKNTQLLREAQESVRFTLW